MFIIACVEHRSNLCLRHRTQKLKCDTPFNFCGFYGNCLSVCQSVRLLCSNIICEKVKRVIRSSCNNGVLKNKIELKLMYNEALYPERSRNQNYFASLVRIYWCFKNEQKHIHFFIILIHYQKLFNPTELCLFMFFKI